MLDFTSLNISEAAEDPKVVVVRISTNIYRTQRGFSKRRDVNFLRKKCSGFNFVQEELSITDANCLWNSIINIEDVSDGIYNIVITGCQRDWETGELISCDYKLVEYEDNE